MTVLLDSWCWIEFFQGTKKGELVKPYLEAGNTIFISVINLAEVYRKLLTDYNVKTADQYVKHMLSRCFLIPVDHTIALNAGQFNAKHKLGLGDSLIFESAKAHDLKLVTGDPGFKGMKEVEYLGK